MGPTTPHFRPLACSALTLLVVLLGHVIPWSLPLLSMAELASYDFRLVFESRFRPMPRSDRITVVGIEDHSLETYGRWPWPRTYIADVIGTLAEMGATDVFMDIAFPESEDPAAGEDLTGWAFGEQVLQKLDATRAGVQEIDASTFGGDPQLAAAVNRVLVPTLDGVLSSLDLQVRQWLPRSPDDRFAESLSFARQLGMRTTGVFTLNQAAEPRQAELEQRLRAILDERVKNRQKIDLHWFRAELPPDLKEFVLEHWTRVHRHYFEDFGRQLLAGEEASSRLGDPVAFHEWVVSDLGWLGGGSALRVIEAEYARHLILSRNALELDAGPLAAGGPTARSMTPPVPLLAFHLQAAGADNRLNDVDGKIRACPLFWRLGDRFVPSAALTLVMHQAGGKPALTVKPGPALEILEPGGEVTRIPLRPDGAMRIHWAGRYRESFPEVAAGMLLDYAGRKRQRELYFHERSKGGEYAYILHLRDVSRRTTLLGAQRPVSLTELDELSQRTWGKAPIDLKDLLNFWGTKVAGQTTVPTHTELREPKAWLRYFEGMRAAWEETFFEGYRRRLAKYEKMEDVEKRKKMIARLQEEYGELDRLVREVEHLGKELRQRLEGRICFLGSTASSSTDLSPTPFESIAPNVGMYANVLNTFLQRRFIHRPGILGVDIGGPVDVQLPVLVAVCLIVPWVLMHLTVTAGSFWALSFILSWIGLALALFAWKGIWLDMASPVAACLVGYIVVYSYKYFRTEHVKKVFESYVDPEIVRVVMEDDRVWQTLGGVEQNITPFFSDVAGFTTISELLKPEELSQMLTDYLSPMTDLIHEDRGILDKYIGDAIVAFFGYPVRDSNHPFNACHSAIRQQRLIVELRRRWESEKRPWYLRLRAAGMEMEFRVGLNTGNAKVGNFGSESSRNYTMIGDTVNLAARLEGANKEYGTRIMASEATYLQCRERIVFRDLDRLQVKGKTVPVKVYEVVGIPGELEPFWNDLLPVYGEGLHLYHERSFAAARARFEEALRVRPGDGPATLYVTRCLAFEAAPPPESWDGSYAMTHK